MIPKRCSYQFKHKISFSKYQKFKLNQLYKNKKETWTKCQSVTNVQSTVKRCVKKKLYLKMKKGRSKTKTNPLKILLGKIETF